MSLGECRGNSDHNIIRYTITIQKDTYHFKIKIKLENGQFQLMRTDLAWRNWNQNLAGKTAIK